MESDPEFFGPAALAKGFRFVGDPRDSAAVERLEAYNDEHGIWDCTRCYFCNERCPKGVDPRDAIAKLGADSIREGSTATWVRSTRSGSCARRRRRVASRDRARAEDAGRRVAVKETKFALSLARRGKVRSRSLRTSQRTCGRRAPCDRS